MKKIVFILAIFTLLFIPGCWVDNTDDDVETKLNNIEDWLVAEIPFAISEDLELPVTHPSIGGAITWDSSDITLLTNEGEFLLAEGTETVNLFYTITYKELDKSGVITINLTTVTFDDVAEMFANQINDIIARDYDSLRVSYENDLYQVTWNSSNEDVFSNLGKYNAPEYEEEITIAYTVHRGSETKNYTIERKVKERSILDKAREIQEWVKSEYLPYRVVEDNLELPTKFQKIRNDELVWEVDINWYSSNYNVISSTGVITKYGFDRYVNLVGEFTLEGETTYFSFDLIVEAKDITTEADRINDFLDAIALTEIEKLTFSGYSGMNHIYNYLPFYVGNGDKDYWTEISKQKIIPDAKRSPGSAHAGIEFITIHDTANPNAGAQAHADLQYNGYSAASWHFQVDELGPIQSIPLTEYAHHAGDGSRYFDLLQTGVKANGIKYPDITIGTDGYYYLNGVKSLIKAPGQNKIAPAGIYTEIDEQGNYLMNRTYYNSSFGYISNHGGNRNSIGIETCINIGNDYATTLRHTATLVAELLIEFDLGVERVMQHNNFSGKYCPRAIIDTNYWSAFLDQVSLEKYAREHFADVEFTWTSNSDNLTNDGKIDIDSVAGTEVSYSVVVNYGNETITKQFTTTLR